MSHYTVLVIGEDVEQQLAPFQENNMGDCPSEFMEFVDFEDDCRREYHESSVERVVVTSAWLEKQKMPMAECENATWKHLQTAIKEGETEFFLAPWDDLFRVLGGGIHEAPPELERREKAFKDLYPTFESFMTQWHGHEHPDAQNGRYGYYENPNARWDWYQIGGRWSGFFKVKPVQLLTNASSLKTFGFSAAEIETLVKKYQADRATFDRLVAKYSGKSKEIAQAIENLVTPIFPPDAKLGEKSWCNENEKTPRDRADQLRKRDVDFEGMYAEAEKVANKTYNLVEAATQGISPPMSFKEFSKEFSCSEQAREAWKEHPWIKAISNEKKLSLPFFGPDPVEYFCVNAGKREEFVRNARLKTIATFAVLMDGQWYAQGEMGWFGLFSDNMTEQNWLEEYHKLLAQLPDDTLLTIVDCHI